MQNWMGKTGEEEHYIETAFVVEKKKNYIKHLFSLPYQYFCWEEDYTINTYLLNQFINCLFLGVSGSFLKSSLRNPETELLVGQQ